MDMPHVYWDETTNQRVKYEGCSSNDESRIKDDRSMYCCETNLNFSTANCSEDDSEYVNYKKHHKVARQDPMSHRIIEKRRRDRMNNCLADLSRLIPTEYLKKGRGRIEKTEIIEMAIKHMKYLQQEHTSPSEHYILGYQECMSETMRFMVEVEGHFPRDGICVRILNHLQKHCDNLSRVPSRPSPVGGGGYVHSMTPLVDAIAKPTPNYQPPKIETNNNNNTNGNHISHQNKSVISNDTNGTSGNSTNNTNGDYDKVNEFNGVSYKYKTNIKLRFSQDLNEVVKRRKTMDNGRRNSITSEQASEEQKEHNNNNISSSTNNNSNRMSPAVTESSSSASLKLDQSTIIRHQEVSPIVKNPFVKNQNFNVPVFVLHAKGAYYIPLSIDYKTLLPFLHNYDLFEVLSNIVLHPVTINVNFQPNCNGGDFIVNNY